jgi:hypothetical protein
MKYKEESLIHEVIMTKEWTEQDGEWVDSDWVLDESFEGKIPDSIFQELKWRNVETLETDKHDHPTKARFTRTNYVLSELIEHDTTFSNAYRHAKIHFYNSDDIFDEFRTVKYKAFGFAGIILFKMIDSDVWEAGLRNDINWDAPKLACSGDTAKEAMSQLYAWCVMNKYLEM